MTVEQTDVLVIGAGQAGLAMSGHLGQAGIDHRVLERDRIAERWRTHRWDSLVANGPAWHDRFPSKAFSGFDPDAFVPKDAIADYFVDYARDIGAPVREGVEVTAVDRLEGTRGFRVRTTAGEFEALQVIVATGPFQIPVVPSIVPTHSGLTQLHSTAYRNPGQLPEGGVLVVGSGSSGVQIADELCQAGRPVYLSVGPHDRPPRRYRGRDFVWWLGVLNKWDAEATPGVEHTTIAVSGAAGGHTIDFRNLAANGITLLGRTESFDGQRLHFSDDLAANIRAGDENYLALLREADDYVARYGLDLPEEPEAHRLAALPDSVQSPQRELVLSEAGIGTIIWATGFEQDFSWLNLDVFDEAGRPRHNRGISSEPGLYFLGLPWLSRRGSSFIWGVWHDARFIADHIQKQQSYFTYQGPVRSREGNA